jgi:hypothetical protein
MIFKKYYAFFTGLVAFIVYLFTLAPSVIQIDSGELAAVQCKLGIAHPTGYPLFTILGFLFQSIPFPFSKIFILNLLNTVWCSLGVGFFALSIKLVLDNLASFDQKKTLKEDLKLKTGKRKAITNNKSKTSPNIISEEKKILTACTGGLLLAFSKTFWAQSTSVEVYSLHVFLLTLIIYFLLKAFLGNDTNIKRWLILSLFTALSFSNHMTTILILPGIAYLYFNRNGFNPASLKRAGWLMLSAFLIICIFYLYLPIRASQNPIIDWGNPIDFERILRHISGKQYQVWLFSSTESARKQFEYFFNNLPGEFAIVGILFCLIGIFNSFFIARKLFIFLVICFLTTLFYSINYSINDIDSYFLLDYIALSFFAAFGIVKIFSLLKSKKNSYLLPSAAISILLLIQIYINFNKVNQHDVHTFEDYTKAVLQSTAKNSVIFSYEWDYLVSPSYYFQHVENFRKDVTVIDKELLRRSWYYNQLQTNHPDVVEKIRNESTIFTKAVQPFERDEKYDQNYIEQCYRNVMTGLAVKITDNNRCFYIASELFDNEMRTGQFTIPKGYYLVPDLFLFKVVKNNNYIPAADPDFTIRFPKARNHYIDLIENIVGTMLVRRAMYEMQFNKTERAKVYINKIKKDLPGYNIPYNLDDVIK